MGSETNAQEMADASEADASRFFTLHPDHLKTAFVALAILAGLVSIANLLLTGRLFVPAFALSASAIFIALYVGTRLYLRVAKLSMWGGWAACMANLYVFAGARSPILLTIPILIPIMGFLVGRTHAVMMAVATAIVLCMSAILEEGGFLVFAPPVPSFSLWITAAGSGLAGLLPTLFAGFGQGRWQLDPRVASHPGYARLETVQDEENRRHRLPKVFRAAAGIVFTALVGGLAIYFVASQTERKEVEVQLAVRAAEFYTKGMAERLAHDVAKARRVATQFLAAAPVPTPQQVRAWRLMQIDGTEGAGDASLVDAIYLIDGNELHPIDGVPLADPEYVRELVRQSEGRVRIGQSANTMFVIQPTYPGSRKHALVAEFSGQGFRSYCHGVLSQVPIKIQVEYQPEGGAESVRGVACEATVLAQSTRPTSVSKVPSYDLPVARVSVDGVEGVFVSAKISEAAVSEWLAERQSHPRFLFVALVVVVMVTFAVMVYFFRIQDESAGAIAVRNAELKSSIEANAKKTEELEDLRSGLDRLVQQQTRELQLAKQNLQFALELTSAGYWETLPHKDMIFLDERTASQMGIAWRRDGLYTLRGDFYGNVVGDREELRMVFSKARPEDPIHEHFDVTFEWRKPSTGDVVWMRTVGKAAYAIDGALTRSGAIQDVTAVKHREAALREAREAAQAVSEAKSRFLAHMSHEIRTPLNAILGLSDAFITGSEGLASKDALEKIHGAGKHLLSIVNDVLDYSKIEAGQLQIILRPVGLAALLRQCSDMVGVLAAAKGLNFHLDAGAGLPVTLRTDKTRLLQILINLLGNAVKFTDRGGIVLSVIRSQENLLFSVADTGAGVRGEDLERIFEPFVQVDDTTTRRHGGTGLGLPICRHLATMMGGKLEAVSESGHGSTFTLVLPLVDAVFERGDTQDSALVLTENKKLEGVVLLVVSEFEFGRVALEMFMAEEGATVYSVGDGDQAERVLHGPSGTGVDAIVVDAEGTSAEALSWVRRALDVRQNTVILIGGSVDMEGAIKIPEGLDADEVVKAVKAALT